MHSVLMMGVVDLFLESNIYIIIKYFQKVYYLVKLILNKHFLLRLNAFVPSDLRTKCLK